MTTMPDMTPQDLEMFMQDRGWTRKRMGTELEITQDYLRAMLKGETPIRRHMRLALAALAYRMPPYRGK